MAIVIEANYTKKLGLPGYSSHQYSVTLRTELADLNQVEAESARLHTLLQTSVDKEIQKVGFLPDKGNGNGNGNGNGRSVPGNGNGHPNGAQNGNGNRDVWNCSPKQKQYIIDLVNQNRLEQGRSGAPGAGPVRQIGAGAQQAGSQRPHRGTQGTGRQERAGNRPAEWTGQPTGRSAMIATLESLGSASQPTQPEPPSRVEELQQTVSASRLGLWHTCRLKFYFRYVLRLQKPPTPALHVGKVVHAVLQAWNMARWRKEPFALDRFRGRFDLSWQEENKGAVINWDGKEEAQQSTAWSMLETYFAETPIGADERPEAVEVRVETSLADHWLPLLIGILDLVRAGGRIVDFKTAGKTPESKTGRAPA